MNVGDWVFGETSLDKVFVKGFVIHVGATGVLVHITEAEDKSYIGTHRAVHDPYPVPSIFDGDDVDPAMMVELSLILKDKEMFMKWSGRLAKEKAAKTTT